MKRLLLVEDEEHERFTLTRVLERAGFSVVALPDGEGVLPRLEAEDFDALLLDVMMPGADGISVARKVASVRPQLPIILVSAFHLFPGQLERLDLDRVYFLDKPLDLDRLLDVLEGRVPPRRARSDSRG
ncbi:MAG: response regulator [Deltaproteobacteria bacterium]|nr:response regulator [Deltaproteobacteria bacterium]